MIGTIRTLDYDMQKKLNDEMKKRVPAIAKAFGGDATIEIDAGYPITYNDKKLTAQMLPSLTKSCRKRKCTFNKCHNRCRRFFIFSKENSGIVLLSRRNAIKCQT